MSGIIQTVPDADGNPIVTSCRLKLEFLADISIQRLKAIGKASFLAARQRA